MNEVLLRLRRGRNIEKDDTVWTGISVEYRYFSFYASVSVYLSLAIAKKKGLPPSQSYSFNLLLICSKK